MTPNTIHIGDCLTVMKGWPDGCVDCAITSIPYWGLRSYLWGGDKTCKHKWADIDDTLQGCGCGALRPRYGIEPTLDEFLAKTVEIFAEVRRVLKSWGTLWLNVGDKYMDETKWGGKTGGKHVKGLHGEDVGRAKTHSGLAPGNLLMLPARVALALQADGWVLRSEIIWVKAWSFHECNGRRIVENGTDLFGEPYEDVIVDEKDYVGSCMPESVSGWAWKRHKVKIKAGKIGKTGYSQETRNKISGQQADGSNTVGGELALWQDCPGCKVCEPNGGLVLRKGNWRTTKAHEQMFQFSKPGGYYCDAEAVKEEAEYGRRSYFRSGIYENNAAVDNNSVQVASKGANRGSGIGGRNLRDCWCISTQPCKDAHFATFPEKLVEPCIKAGTSEKGNCPKCGMPWVRVIDSRQIKRDRPADKTDRHNQGNGVNSCGNTVAGVENTTIGWRPSCNCNAGDSPGDKPVPAVVLDMFMGSGTVGLVAERLGRNWLGIEINPEYAAIAEKRLGKEKGTML